MDRNLIDYLPEILQKVRELKAIVDTEQPELVTVWAALDDVLNDQFISDASENGVERIEHILQIVPQATRTLDERKFLILARLNEEIPFTMTALKRQLESLCGVDGYSAVLENETYTLTIKVALTASNNFDDVGKLLQRIIPANLAMNLILMFNQYNLLAGFTHDQLALFTYDQLRNEVFS